MAIVPGEGDLPRILYVAAVLLIPLFPAFLLSNFFRKEEADALTIVVGDLGSTRMKWRVSTGIFVYLFLVLFIWSQFPPKSSIGHISYVAAALLIPLVPASVLHFWFNKIHSESNALLRLNFPYRIRIYGRYLPLVALFVTYVILVFFVREVFSSQLGIPKSSLIVAAPSNSVAQPPASSPAPNSASSPAPNSASSPAPNSASSPAPNSTSSPAPNSTSKATRIESILSWIPSWQSLALSLPTIAFVIFLFLFVLAVQRGVPLQVESHWGGFGGGLGGWRLSAALAYLIASISMATIAAVVVLRGGSEVTETQVKSAENRALVSPTKSSVKSENSESKTEAKTEDHH